MATLIICMTRIYTSNLGFFSKQDKDQSGNPDPLTSSSEGSIHLTTTPISDQVDVQETTNFPLSKSDLAVNIGNLTVLTYKSLSFC